MEFRGHIPELRIAAQSGSAKTAPNQIRPARYGCTTPVNLSTTCLNPGNGTTPGYAVATWVTPKGGSSGSFAEINAEDARGHVTSRATANGMLTLETYDPQTRRLTGITTGPCSGNCGAPSSVQNLTYGYDPLGNLQTRNDAVNGTREVFGYNENNALKEVDFTSGSWSGSQSFGWDTTGNMTFKSDLGTMQYGPPGGGGLPAGQVGPHQLSKLRVYANASPYWQSLTTPPASNAGCSAAAAPSWTQRCLAYWDAGMVFLGSARGRTRWPSTMTARGGGSCGRRRDGACARAGILP